MSKRRIKIVKRDAPVPAPVAPPAKPKDPERGITNAVKNWISERRESEKKVTHRTVNAWN
jgi:hypothetical protein